MQDITGKNGDSLKEKTLFLLDMDGTIYNENEIFPGGEGEENIFLLPIIPPDLWQTM